MEYENASNDCQALENDWLDISYVQRNYINDEKAEEKPAEEKEKKTPAKKQRARLNIKSIKISKRSGIAIVSVFLVAILITGLLMFSGMSITAWLNQAKDTFLNAFDHNPSKTLTLPAVTFVENITDGDIILTGGSVAINMKTGTVGTVTENSVSVDIGDNTVFVYSQLTEIFVESGQTLSEFDVVGRYEEMAVVSIYINGQKVTDVTNDGRKIIWRES